MGYLTTFAIRNDRLHKIMENKDAVMDAIYRHAATINPSTTLSENGEELKYGGDPIIAFKTRHADETAIYLHHGNTVTEFNPYSDNFLKNPNWTKTQIKEIERFLKIAKKKYKEYEKS